MERTTAILAKDYQDFLNYIVAKGEKVKVLAMDLDGDRVKFMYVGNVLPMNFVFVKNTRKKLYGIKFYEETPNFRKRMDWKKILDYILDRIASTMENEDYVDLLN
jgi:hypothetical protein